MSCSVKISCGKSWNDSQRRINSLTEETTCPSNAGSNCTVLPANQLTSNMALMSTISTTTTSAATTTSNIVVAFNSSVATSTTITITTTTSTSTKSSGNTAINTNISAAGTQRVVPPRPVKSIAVKKGEDTTKLLKYIDDNVIGKNGTFFGPFGRRKGQWSI